MRPDALAADYDGTLAQDGRIDRPTVAALRRLLKSGRKLVMVTGRELDELLEVCPEVDLFERVVAENGALLYRPATREETVLSARPPGRFVEALRARGVDPISVGRVIVATWMPHETTILEVIGDLGLKLQVIKNKRALMILPSGVDTATGLAAALGELGISPRDVVGVGDAENDLAFLASCGYSVAVGNALPAVKDRAFLVTQGERGAGVAELIDWILFDDRTGLGPRSGGIGG